MNEETEPKELWCSGCKVMHPGFSVLQESFEDTRVSGDVPCRQTSLSA